MKYAYQRQGGPILSWKRAAPQQSRGADAKSLGSLSGDTLGVDLLPRAGAPEPISGCSGCGMGAVTGTVTPADQSLINRNRMIAVAGVVGAFLLFKKLKKRR